MNQTELNKRPKDVRLTFSVSPQNVFNQGASHGYRKMSLSNGHPRTSPKQKHQRDTSRLCTY